MNKQVTNLLNKLTTTTKTQNKKKKNVNRRPSTRQRTRALPAAYAAHVRPRFRIVSRMANSVVVEGCDLIYPIPRDLNPDSDTIFAIFPANPAYWAGTRIAQFAPAYANYRPLSFKVSYIPQVAVTQQGTVFMGTLWNQAAPSSNIQQSLFTSNGGCLTQCYVPCDTTVILGSNLQQNLYTMNDSLHPDTCPFIFLAGVRGAQVVPGYFYVTYKFEFKNPLGTSWSFNTLGPITFEKAQAVEPWTNMTFVLTDEASYYGPGTQLDLEMDGSVYYHGTSVSLPAETHGILYTNKPTSINNTNITFYTTLDNVTIDGVVKPISEFSHTTTGLTVSPGKQAVMISAKPDGWIVDYYNNTTAGDATFSGSFTYYVYTAQSNFITINNSLGEPVFELSHDTEDFKVLKGFLYVPVK